METTGFRVSCGPPQAWLKNINNDIVSPYSDNYKIKMIKLMKCFPSCEKDHAQPVVWGCELVPRRQ